MRKPETITYGPDDRPPTPVLLMLVLQQVVVLSIFLLAPVLATRAAGLPETQASNLISVTMIGLAVATILQVRRWGPVGSGMLITSISASNFIPGCVIALREGGLPMMAGLLLIAGFLEAALSRFFRVLRGLLPTELSGLVVLVTGLGVAQAGMDNVVAGMVAADGARWLQSLLVSCGTLAVMVGLTVWARRPLSTFGACAGLVIGYVASLLTGLVDTNVLDAMAPLPVLRLPSIGVGWPSVGRAILVPALVTGVAVTLNSVGALTAAQRLHDADWHRQDLNGLSRGLLADGLGVMLSASLGGAGVCASGSSVSLTATARATSRIVGYGAAATFLVLAVVPRFALLVLSVPPPVFGAVLVFLSCSLMVSGVMIMSSRLLDTRKTFSLGIPFAFAVAAATLTRLHIILPDWMTPMVGSPLLIAAMIAIMLNPIMRLGIRQSIDMPIPVGGVPNEEVAKFINRAGAAWGARRDVIARAQGPIAECLDTLVDAELADGPGRLTLRFNELQLDARITWHGAPLVLSRTPPTKEELVTDDTAAARMAGYLIARLTSRVSSRVVGGMAEVRLTFDH